MQFKIVAQVKRWIKGEKREECCFSAVNAEEARKLALERFHRAFHRARLIILYQLLNRPPKNFFERVYPVEKVWHWDLSTGWCRDIPGHSIPLAEAPDEASDEALLQTLLSRLT